MHAQAALKLLMRKKLRENKLQKEVEKLDNHEDELENKLEDPWQCFYPWIVLNRTLEIVFATRGVCSTQTNPSG